jgi:hypothetical protein
MNVLSSQAGRTLPCALAAGLFALLLAGCKLPWDRKPATEKLVLIGEAASHTILDGGGGWFNDGKPTEIIIRSQQVSGAWQRPVNITIRNGRLRGSIRIMGLGRNGEAAGVRESSVSLGHTERAQAAAPTAILISNVEIEAEQAIALYVGPGVTGVTFENSTITGNSRSTAVYLDAESGGNIIRNNTFEAQVGREVIAVDGSAGNRIEGNRFAFLPYGGIYLYRNCGEGGTVRHQPPRDNIIAGNEFAMNSLGWWSYAIWIGARNGWRLYCWQDAGYSFGSSADNRDFADHNTVTGNVFLPSSRRDIRNDGTGNVVAP